MKRLALFAVALVTTTGIGGVAASTATAATPAPLHPAASTANVTLPPGQKFPISPITPERNSAPRPRSATVAPTGAPKYDVTTYGFDQARSGKNTAETGLGTSNVANLTAVWNTGFTVTGAMDATPVGASDVSTPTGVRDLLYAGNEGGGFGAIDADTGQVVWQVNTGFTQVPCGDFPSGHAGVTGAAVIDRAANRVYMTTGTGWLVGYTLDTGTKVSKWQMTGFPQFKHAYGALNLDAAHHRIYTTLAGMCDRNPYQGSVEAFDTTTGARTVWTSMASSQNGGGIWGWGGASLDQSGNPFAATGNANPWGPGEANLYAERIIRLNPTMTLNSSHHPGLGSAKDVDFGATPTLFHPPGCFQDRAAVENKNGTLYIYVRDFLNNGPVESIPFAAGAGPGGPFVGLPAFDVATGIMYVSNPSTGGQPHGMVARKFDPANACRSAPAWNTVAGPSSSPVSSPTIANGVVYYGDGVGNTLHAFDAATGQQLWSGSIGGAEFSAPTVFDGRVYASSRNGTLHAFG